MGSKRSFFGWILGIGLVALVILPIALLYFSTAGLVYGEEFSPDDFRRRSFSYNVVPWFNYTLQGIDYEDVTPVLEQTLVADGLIKPSKNVKTKSQIWHLVSDSQSQIDRSSDFDARILCRYLDMTEPEGENIWVVWNADHPKLSKVFWPTVSELARHQIYWAIPDVMRRALSVSDDDDPDLLFAWMNRYANQVNTIDASIDWLLEALPDRRATLMLAGSSSFALGENGWIGHHCGPLRSCDKI